MRVDEVDELRASRRALSDYGEEELASPTISACRNGDASSQALGRHDQNVGCNVQIQAINLQEILRTDCFQGRLRGVEVGSERIRQVVLLA